MGTGFMEWSMGMRPGDQHGNGVYGVEHGNEAVRQT